jgi:hypothetical protein
VARYLKVFFWDNSLEKKSKLKLQKKTNKIQKPKFQKGIQLKYKDLGYLEFFDF